MIKPNPANCNNCPHLCAHHCEQLSYKTQHGAVLIIFPLLTSRQESQLRYCLLEGRGYNQVQNNKVLQWTGQASLQYLLSCGLITLYGHVAQLSDDTPFSGK